MASTETVGELQEALDVLMEAFNTIKQIVKGEDQHLYERWKAGGFAVSGDFLSMYPSVESVVESIEVDEEPEDEEFDDDDWSMKAAERAVHASHISTDEP